MIGVFIIQVKDLRDLTDAIANKQAEIAKYEANADKKSKDIQSTIETTVTQKPTAPHRSLHPLKLEAGGCGMGG